MGILIYSRLSTWLILVYLTLYWVPRRRILWHRTISLCIDHTLDRSQFREDNLCLLTLILSPLSLVMSSQQVGTRTVSTKIMHLQLCQRELFWLLGNNIADNPPQKTTLLTLFQTENWASASHYLYFLTARWIKNEQYSVSNPEFDAHIGTHWQWKKYMNYFTKPFQSSSHSSSLLRVQTDVWVFCSASLLCSSCRF